MCCSRNKHSRLCFSVLIDAMLIGYFAFTFLWSLKGQEVDFLFPLGISLLFGLYIAVGRKSALLGAVEFYLETISVPRGKEFAFIYMLLGLAIPIMLWLW